MTCRQQGLSLLELLIAVAISTVLIMVLFQLQRQSSLAFDRQQQFSRQLDNAASLQHLISHALRDALYTLRAPDSQSAELRTVPGCAGIVLQQICSAPVTAWTVQSSAGNPVSGAVAGSSVLQLKQNCCAGVVADQFYLSHRAGLTSNPLALYRRRLASDGSYTPAVELVEGVAEFVVSFVVQHNDAGDLAHLTTDQVIDWWRLRAVRIHFRLTSADDGQDDNEAGANTASLISFTIASRQWQQSGENNDGVMYATP